MVIGKVTCIKKESTPKREMPLTGQIQSKLQDKASNGKITTTNKPYPTKWGQLSNGKIK